LHSCNQFLLCSFSGFFAVGGCILGAWSADRVGRRAALLVYGILNIIGWLLIFLAQYIETASAFRVFLLCGRLWTGVSSGALTSIFPVYVAEIAPPNKRGMLGATYQISVITGIFLSYVAGAISGLTYSHSALIVVLGLSLSTPLVLFIKESPRWLLLKNNKDAARKSLLWLFQSDEAAKQSIELIEESLPPISLSFCEKIKTKKRVPPISTLYIHRCFSPVYGKQRYHKLCCFHLSDG
jgi:MFS family permease